tara:strand:+ start:4573 stop:4848 length:276 start_codon:yes stop_codon:yes gene_type:complete
MIYNVIDDATPLVVRKTIVVNTDNGILNKEVLRKEKRKMFIDNLDYLVEQYVKVNKEYPVNNLSNVHLSLEVAVLEYEDFLEIKKYIDGDK